MLLKAQSALCNCSNPAPHQERQLKTTTLHTHGAAQLPVKDSHHSTNYSHCKYHNPSELRLSATPQSCRKTQPLSVYVPLLFSSGPLHLSNSDLMMQVNQKRERSSPPVLLSVARATVAILPCPVSLGYTSQASHKCGMTVKGPREGRTNKDRV